MTTHPDEQLIEAVFKGDLACVQALLADGINPNQEYGDGHTPVFVAARRGFIDVVRALIAAGADVNACNDGADTPAIIAAYEGHLPVVQALIEAGAQIDRGDLSGMTPLHCAAYGGHAETVKYLLAAGAAPDLRYDDECTPLMTAVCNGATAAVAALIAGGAALNLQDTSERTALIMCACSDSLDCARLLLEAGADATIRDESGFTALDCAVRIRPYSGRLIRLLVEAGTPPDDEAPWVTQALDAFNRQDDAGFLAAIDNKPERMDAFSTEIVERIVLCPEDCLDIYATLGDLHAEMIMARKMKHAVQGEVVACSSATHRQKARREAL